MRLVLSSWYLRPGQRPSALRPMAGRGRAGIVLNALDQFGAARVRDLDRESRTLADLGYISTELDLREYFAAPSRLSDRLADVDLVWAVGGNAFVLARAMAQSGFAAAVRDRLADSTFVYGGYSAGSCVAGPDLAGIELVDDPEVMPDGYRPQTKAAGLGLVPDRILPHWRSDHPESEAIERAAASLSKAGEEYRCLRDGQALVVDGSSMSLCDLDEPSGVA